MNDIESMAMKIQCPSCGDELEIPNDDVVGCHFQCSCGARFTFDENGNVLLLPSQKDDSVKRPRLPIWSRLAIIFIYILTALGFMGTVQKNAVISVSVAVVMASMNFCFQQGANWARIALTVITGCTWIASAFFNTWAAIIILVLWAAPISFLWLPTTNRWVKDKTRWVKWRRQHCPELYRGEKIAFKIILTLLCAACIWGSGYFQWAIWDGFSCPNNWKSAFLAFIPLWPICSLLQLFAGMFVESCSFLLELLQFVLCCVGYGGLSYIFGKKKPK